MPNSVALLREVVPETRSATRLGLISAAIGVAAAGPPVGGLLTDIAGWQAIFSQIFWSAVVASLGLHDWPGRRERQYLSR